MPLDDAPAGARPKLRMAVDIGGTFTDLAAFDEAAGELRFGKALTTHGKLVDGIQNTVDIAGASFADAHLFLHGSTIAINTLLERTGAKTVLLVTEGFRDIYEIGRVNRPDAYNLFFKKHVPLVDRSSRFEVHERLLASGAVHKPLDEDNLRSVLRSLEPGQVEAVAILLLHSYRNPAHEVRVKQIVTEELPGAFVSASHELSQEYREFERVSTVAANAYVGPRVATYLGELSDHLARHDFGGAFFVVQSTGGLFPVEHARRDCVRMLESGPAAGVIGTQAICEGLGLSDAIAFDMGGTTAKAGVIYRGKPLTTGSALLGGYDQALPIQIPMTDIFEVGTGGGSIARLGQGNALRVGPQSAGSMPGPVCYGRGGTEPTVTDANLLLGRLDPDHFLGGTMALDLAGAERAMHEKIAGPLGMDVHAAADGILRIAVTTMSYAVKAVTTERGLDVGGFVMAVYGGAGPLHASAIAREIGIRRVMIPYAPGYFSAYGMLFSDLRYDYVRSCFRRLATADFAEIEGIYAGMESEGRTAIKASAVTPERIEIERAADMRYVGQEHAVTVELPREVFERGDREAIKRHFDAQHEVRYGTSAPGEPAELVSLRVTVSGVMRKPPRHSVPAGGPDPDAEALVRRKQAYFGRLMDTPVYTRDRLKAGNRISGPALIEEHASTTVLQPGDALEVDAAGNLLIAIGSDA
ncbi:hydantoinase/oxoprolinase family protein [Falsiroseomonas sp. HW251]|uniref:hydantoinase/oxoprolinase family protein n=1 Tax=Falsiroseomonas sp. HW251 TaxID=3390998 RepID=UPI003D31CB81